MTFVSATSAYGALSSTSETCQVIILHLRLIKNELISFKTRMVPTRLCFKDIYIPQMSKDCFGPSATQIGQSYVAFWCTPHIPVP